MISSFAQKKHFLWRQEAGESKLISRRRRDQTDRRRNRQTKFSWWRVGTRWWLTFVSSFSIEILPIKFRLWFALFKLHFVIDPFLFLESQRTKQVYVDFSFLVTLNTMRTSDTKTLEFIMNRKCTNKQNKFVVAYFRLFSDNLFSNWVDIY